MSPVWRRSRWRYFRASSASAAGFASICISKLDSKLTRSSHSGSTRPISSLRNAGPGDDRRLFVEVEDRVELGVGLVADTLGLVYVAAHDRFLEGVPDAIEADPGGVRQDDGAAVVGHAAA